jgi:hypothetical protein
MFRSLSVRVVMASLSVASAATGAYGAAAGPSIDLQIGLCESPAQVERVLALQPRGAPFDVWLFDDPALALLSHGLRVRLRGTKAGAELTLKVADQDCAAVPGSALPAGEGKCEYDLHGDKVAGALSLTKQVDRRTADDLVAGRAPLAGALSEAQRRFLHGRPGAWPLPPGVRALGPTRVRSYNAKGKPYVVDISVLPGGEQFIEISRKVPLAEARPSQARFEADLAEAGVPACAAQSAQAVNKLRALLRE